MYFNSERWKYVLMCLCVARGLMSDGDVIGRLLMLTLTDCPVYTGGQFVSSLSFSGCRAAKLNQGSEIQLGMYNLGIKVK